LQEVAAAGHERDGGAVVASRRAVAAPIPLLAPVTSAAVPASFGVMGVVSSCLYLRVCGSRLA
jgi:hypothetical protein